jgi:hypothetical protein
VVCSRRREYGYGTYQLNAQDDERENQIIRKAEDVQEKEQRIGE